MGISPTTASAVDYVTVTVSISDATGVTGDFNASVALQSDTGEQAAFPVWMRNWVLLSGDATNGTYEATLQVRQGVAAGVYRAIVWAIDDLANDTSEIFEDVLTIEVFHSDTDGPEISFVGISPTTASAGDNVTVTVSISDATGVPNSDSSTTVTLQSDTGVTASMWKRLVLLSGDATNGIYEATLTVDSVAGGVYGVSVSANDGFWNATRELFEDVLTIEGPSDADGPEISFVGISPTTASAGDNVTVTVSISDATGVTGASVNLQSDTGVQASDGAHLSNWVLLTGDATNGIYEATLTVNNPWSQPLAGGGYRATVSAIDDLANSTFEIFEDVLTIEGP